MDAKREFIQGLTYNVNNGNKLELIQRRHNGTVLISDNSISNVEFIPPNDMVMLVNLYRYVKENDIQNDFINPYGKNKET